MLLGHTKKSALKSKEFFTLCAYPSLGKKEILSTLSEPCYCHVGEGLAGQPLQKAAQVHAQMAEDGPGQQGKDEQVLKFSRLTCSCSQPVIQNILKIVHCSVFNFWGFVWPYLPCFYLFC